MMDTLQPVLTDESFGLPTYSVVIPVHGDGKFLEDAVRSVTRQSHSPLEIILVNDAANPEATSIMSALCSSDDRIRLVNTAWHSGAGPARNLGIESCSGEFIALLDSDDLWVAEKMARQLSTMRDRKALFSATQYGTIDSGQLIEIPRKKTSGWISRYWLLANNPIGTSGVVVHKDLGLRFPRLRRRQDWAAWIDLANAGQKCFVLDQVLMYHRVGHSPRSLSSSKIACVRYHWRVLRETAELGLLSSMVLFSTSIFFAVIRTVTLKAIRASMRFRLKESGTLRSQMAQIRDPTEGNQAN